MIEVPLKEFYISSSKACTVLLVVKELEDKKVHAITPNPQS